MKRSHYIPFAEYSRIGLVFMTIFYTATHPFILATPLDDIKFERLSLEQGLSQSSVYCIFQDREGFMWFGTVDGLNKYDGYSFTVYHKNVLDPNSLSDDWITSIYEDNLGTLWIGTLSGGLNKFDRENEEFTRLGFDPNDANSISNNNVTRCAY